MKNGTYWSDYVLGDFPLWTKCGLVFIVAGFAYLYSGLI